MDEGLETGFTKLAKESIYPQELLLKQKKKNSTLFIGLPKEYSKFENRISLKPESVKVLVNNGHEIWVESEAGVPSNYSDNDYSEAGAKIVYSHQEVFKADIILKIEPPTLEEVSLFNGGKTLISTFQSVKQTPDYIHAINNKKLIALGYEFIEDKVGGLPLVRAMSEIAGSSVMLIAAEYLSSVKNGKGVILGGITGVPPAKIMILGAGTVGEYAARAAIGLGADIQVYDNNIYKLRRIKRELGKHLYTSTLDQITLSHAISSTDVLVGAIRADKGRSKVIITEEMVSKMKPGSLVIDVSIDQGGCIETSEMTTLENPIFRKYGVIHYCVPNIASRVAKTASDVISNIFTPIILQIAEMGGIEEMIANNNWFLNGVYAYKGSLTNQTLANKYNFKYKDLNLLMAARF